VFQLKVFHLKLIRLKLIHPNRLTLQPVSNSGVEVVGDVEPGVFASNHQAGVEEVQVDLEDPMRDLYLFRSF